MHGRRGNASPGGVLHAGRSRHVVTHVSSVWGCCVEWIQAYLDLQCPFSKASWPVVKQVIASYSDAMTFTFHLFPLPFHHNSFFMAQVQHSNVVGLHLL